MSEHPKNYSRESAKRQGPQGGNHSFGMPMGRPAEKAKNFKGTLRRLVDYLKPYRTSIIIMIAFSIIVTVIGVVAPIFIGRIINDFTAYITGAATIEILDGIALVFLGLAGVYVIRFLFDFASQLIGNRLSATIGKNLRNELRDKLERLPIKFYDESKTGNILSIFSNDVETVTNSLQQSVIFVIVSFLTIIGVLFMMFFISWQLTIISLIALPLYIFFTAKIAKGSQGKFVKQQKELGNLNGYIEEMFSAHKVVKLYGKEADSYQEFSTINDRLQEHAQGAQFLSGMIRPAMDFIGNVSYVFVVFVGGILAGLASPLSIGYIVTFIGYQRSFVQPILNIANIMNTLQSTIAGAERVFQLLDTVEQSPERAISEFKGKDFQGDVTFENVDFSYLAEKPLIEKLNLEVRSGHQIAIVGPTGAGKTTLVNLLMRFYEIQNGIITVDGINTSDVPRPELRKLFGMVLQDTWLFAGTIRENIAYGRPDATNEEVREACRQAHVDHFMDTLPQGYDTILNEDASNISQGQKQLITIARAILSNPRILILDEATSSVDTRTEALIQNAMNNMMQNRTSFVIAHRLSTIKNASTILVMNNGSIVEQGDHKTLLAKHGVYADLYNSQFLNPMV